MAQSRDGRGFERWLYAGGRPNRLARSINRLWAWLASIGWAPARVCTLEVRGRHSGNTVAFPVVVTDHAGERYLVSMLGNDTNWVRNVRAAGGKAALVHAGRREVVQLDEVPVADRPPVLRRYLQVAPGARPHIAVAPDAPDDQFADLAARLPVFRISLVYVLARRAAPDPPETDVQRPLPPGVAWRAVCRSVLRTGVLLARGRIRQPRGHLRVLLHFPDGTAAVYRETEVARRPAGEPCLLIVQFRLRWVRGCGHALFRTESVLNTPLFVGFPGFVSKLWLTHDEHGVYRGVYEWDGAAAARAYARALWRVLALVSEPDSIRYEVKPGARRADLLVTLMTGQPPSTLWPAAG